uniref:ATP-dependent DNA helicase n=1 Tax=Plectus sambesii TaxID=2011161 RepID=A0A914VPN6_9BILA
MYIRKCFRGADYYESFDSLDDSREVIADRARSGRQSAPVIDLVDDDGDSDWVDVDDDSTEWIRADYVQGQPCRLLISTDSRNRVLGVGDGQLDDVVINSAQQILQIQSAGHYAGWASTLSHQMHCIPAGQDGIQIHFARDHWITSCVYNGDVYVFDSLLAIHRDIDSQLCQVYHHYASNNQLVVNTVDCQQQDDSELCGVMAIAFAVEIVTNGFYAAIMARFVQPQMRQWLATCLEARKFHSCTQQFPLAPVAESSWTDRTLTIPSPPPCRLLAESHQQPVAGADNDARDEPVGELFAEEVEKTDYDPFCRRRKKNKKRQLVDDDEDNPELADAAPAKQLHLLTQQTEMDVNISHFSVQDMFDKLPTETDLEIYKMKRVEGEPLSESDPLIDVLCHPTLFPKGRFGIGHDREVKVQPAMYLRSRFRHKDPRFRRDPHYIFAATSRYDVKTIKSGIHSTLQTSLLPDDLTAAKVRELIEENDQTIERSLNSILANCRGTTQYWNNQMRHLTAMDANAGPATFFVTLSAKEYKWEDVREVLELLNQDIPNVTTLRQGFLTTKDPVTVSNQFYNRFKTLMKEAILNEDGPFGKVEYYFWRIEYQARGAPHIHMKLWVKGAPVVGEASDEEVLKFVTKYITCRSPSPVTSPDLYRLVMDNQMHRCGAYCKRRTQTGWRCKFGFPRPVRYAPKLNPLKHALKRRHGRIEKLYHLERSPKEMMVNDYNPLLLYLWRANIDVQFIGETTMVINRYITKYTTKSEKQKTADLWSMIDKSKSTRGQLQSLVLKLFRSREVGHYEACDKVSGHPLHKSNANVAFLNTNAKKLWRRKLIGKKELDGLDANSKSFVKNSFVDTYYPNRPPELENKSLYFMFTWYNVQQAKPEKMENRKHEPHYPLLNGLGYLIKRTTRRWIRTYMPTPDKPDAVEDYFRRLLMMFLPWRDDDSLRGSWESYQEAYRGNEDKIRAEADKFVSQTKRMARTAELMKRLQDEGNEADALDLPAIPSDEFNGPVERQVDEADLDARIAKLNLVQRQIFDDIIDQIVHQERHKINDCICDNLKPPIFRFISGLAGTGKSYLIECIADKLTQLFPDCCGVVIGAPTGVAAFNVKGETLHRLLKLPVHHKDESQTKKKYVSLSRDDQTMLMHCYQGLRLFIIDEVSMISNIMLLQIHSRLNEIFCEPTEPAIFGGINTLFFGDLLQLNPVKADGVYETVRQWEMSLRFGNVVPDFNLWRDVTYSELVENMRQREDLAYSQMLERIRIGSPSQADINALRERQIVKANESTTDAERLQLAVSEFQRLREEYLQGRSQLQQPVALFPKHTKVNQFNANLLRLANQKIEVIMAEDCEMMRKQSKRWKEGKQKQKSAKDAPEKSDDPDKTAGLVEQLELCIGYRVMLRRNISTHQGLTNGAMGTVVDFARGSQEISGVMVVFDSNPDVRTYIEKVEARFFINKEFSCRQKQFPLILAYESWHNEQKVLRF